MIIQSTEWLAISDSAPTPTDIPTPWQRVWVSVDVANRPTSLSVSIDNVWSPVGLNGTVPGSTVGDTTLEQVGHNLTVGTPVYFTATGFAKARSDAEVTLCRYLVKAVTANTVTISRDGDLVGGFTGLVKSEWYHCSATVAGTIEVIPANLASLPGSYAANPVGQAVSSTDLIYRSIIPYRT